MKWLGYGQPQSGRAPENFTTLAHFSVSVGHQLVEIGGRERQRRGAELGQPRLHLGLGQEAPISLFSLSMMSAGVARGAPTP